MSMQYCPKICFIQCTGISLILTQGTRRPKNQVFLAVAGSGSIPTPLLAKTGKASTYAQRKYSEWEEAIFIADELIVGGANISAIKIKHGHLVPCFSHPKEGSHPNIFHTLNWNQSPFLSKPPGQFRNEGNSCLYWKIKLEPKRTYSCLDSDFHNFFGGKVFVSTGNK